MPALTQAQHNDDLYQKLLQSKPFSFIFQVHFFEQIISKLRQFFHLNEHLKQFKSSFVAAFKSSFLSDTTQKTNYFKLCAEN